MASYSIFAQQREAFDAKNEKIEFIRQLFRTDSLKLYVKQSTIHSEDFLCSVHKSDYLNNDEENQADEQLKSINKFIWIDDLYKNIKVISDSSFIKSDIDKLVEDLHQNLIIMSNPIFLRNGKYCVFFYRIVCGGICIQSDLSLYIKERGKWIKKEEYCSWMN